MNKIINLIIIIGLTLFFCSCYSTLRTGRYVINDVRHHGTNTTVTFKGVEGDWNFPNPNVKKGDTVYLQKVKQEKNANVF